uniref:DnaJ heat shock protein family (Hsp40) member C28 n=1 Tax=Leptobrachium leishanense TaxID=445787 RepID=A0A8C5MG71_9ANUR
MKLLSILLVQNAKCALGTPVILYRFSRHGGDGRRLFSSFTRKRSIQECCRVLDVPDDCSAEEVRDSYRKLAKKYHPDSGSVTASASKFMQVDEAYKALLTHLSNQSIKEESQDDDGKKTEYKVPQHRHYLSYEGIGYGTPSQRQKQYTQFRVDRATDHVLDFRKQKMEREHAENAMIAKDVRQSKKVKITQAIERLVEDLIQESMAKGDFDNLTGKGKPLQKFSYCPHVDPMTHNLNRILIDNGYQPEWIVLQKEIRETIVKLRSEALTSRKRLGDPMTQAKRERWDEVCQGLREDIARLNKKINDFNLVVPLLNRQMVHFSAEKEISRAEETYLSMQGEEQKASRENTADVSTDDQQFNLKQTLINLIKHLRMS